MYPTFRNYAGLASFSRFVRHTLLGNLTKRSIYFGYELHSIVGLSRDARKYDDSFRRSENFYIWTFIVWALIGFTG